MNESSVQKITVSQRSRPLRFGLLLRGWNDSDGLRDGVRLFTSLWGGKYNCFIPTDRDPPSWWKGPESGIEIARGYLGAFEPDFLVADDPDLVKGLGFEEDRVLVRSELVRQDPTTPFSHGIGVHELFRWMWRKDFQYTKRNPPEIVLPRATEMGKESLVAVCFGEYPEQDGEGPDFEEEFRLVFNAKEQPLTADELLRLHVKRLGFPLSVGAARLEPRRRSWRFDPLLYLLNPTSTLDLVDFWNLRALGMSPIPVSLPWFDELRPQLAKLVRAAHRPHPQDVGYTTLMRGRSLEEEEANACEKKLREDCPDGPLVRHSHPRICDPWGRAHDHALRADVVASSEETEVVLTGERITLRACRLPIETSFSPYRKVDSVRVVRMRDYSGLSRVASVTPPDLKSARRVLDSWSIDRLWFSSEGIVATCRGRDRFFWRVPRGDETCQAWLTQHGFKFAVTSGGKLMFNAMQRIGGLQNLRILASENLARLLNRMAGRPDRPAKTYPWQALVGRIARDTRNPKSAEHLVQGLVERRALEVGIELKCDHCGQHNWYELEGFRSSLQCHRCLQDFRFPAAHPPENPWRYRTIGPFAVEDYIQGGLSVLLSMRLLANTSTRGLHGDNITWCPSFTLKEGDSDWGEFDALAFIEQNNPYAGSVLPVFVEGKSYGKQEGVFGTKDRDNMRRIGDRFPGSVLVFATLNSELTERDIDLIKPLAEVGREPIHDDHWKNPVVVLTGRELFSEMGPPACWEGVSETEAFAEMHRAGSSLHGLADATQQLYLGMESRSDYIGRWIRNRTHR